MGGWAQVSYGGAGRVGEWAQVSQVSHGGAGTLLKLFPAPHTHHSFTHLPASSYPLTHHPPTCSDCDPQHSHCSPMSTQNAGPPGVLSCLQVELRPRAPGPALSWASTLSRMMLPSPEALASQGSSKAKACTPLLWCLCVTRGRAGG